MMFFTNRLVMAVVVVAVLAGSGLATVIVDVQPASSEVTIGQGFNVSIVATIPDPVVGWGLDLSFDHAVLSLVGSPVIGPVWLPATALDSDGLAGLAFPSSISGTSVLLATVHLSAIAAGETDLTLSVTPGDLTEGFPLDPTGFATMTLGSAHVTAVPEPTVAVLLLVASVLAMPRRRWPGR
jgi:hypothetical protein